MTTTIILDDDVAALVAKVLDDAVVSRTKLARRVSVELEAEDVKDKRTGALRVHALMLEAGRCEQAAELIRSTPAEPATAKTAPAAKAKRTRKAATPRVDPATVAVIEQALDGAQSPADVTVDGVAAGPPRDDAEAAAEADAIASGDLGQVGETATGGIPGPDDEDAPTDDEVAEAEAVLDDPAVDLVALFTDDPAEDHEPEPEADDPLNTDDLEVYVDAVVEEAGR